MRTILAATFMSLDGVMQAPGGPEEDPSGGFRHGGWQAGAWEEAIGEAVDEVFAQPFDLLLGRRTYDIFAAHWPFVPTDPAAEGYEPDMAGIAERFAGIRKYVATHRPDSLAWAGSEWLGADPVATLRALRQTDGPNLLIQGSSVLIQTLLANDLIDRFRLMMSPLVLGGGKRLFGDGTLPRTLRHRRTVTTPGGTLVVDYELGGAVPTASFAMEDPTPEEIARRERMSAEAGGA